MSIWREHCKAIYLFQVTPFSPSVVSILFTTKPICSKRMRRLVSVRVFYILDGGYIRDHTQMLSGFPYGRTQHKRRMRSSIVSVIHYVSTRFFDMSCDLTEDANSPVSCSRPHWGDLGKTHQSEGNNESTTALEMVKHHCFAFNCANNTQKQKKVEKENGTGKYEIFPFPQDNANKYYAAGMSERERRMRWIAACRLDILNLTRHTKICSVHFEGGLGPT